jgi:mannose-1-phosphate guanylyltransferase
MRAIILAAGFGTRLGALGEQRPKPLFPVCDLPLIRYALALLRGHGVTEICVNLHHHGDLIRQELGDEVVYSQEDVILGTGGGLRKMGDWLTRGGKQPFFVVNGKLLVDADLRLLRARHEEADAAATMLLRETPDAARWGAIEVGDDGRVTRIIGQGRPGAHVCMFTGVHILSPRLLGRLPAMGESDSIRQAYLPALADGEPICGVLLDGYFHEHSTPERYLEGNWNALRGRARLRHPPGPFTGIAESARVDGTLAEPVRISDGAIVDQGAHVGPDVVVGKGARVEAGAHLERVVIWPGSVASGELRDAIVTPRGVFRSGGSHE